MRLGWRTGGGGGEGGGDGRGGGGDGGDGGGGGRGRTLHHTHPLHTTPMTISFDFRRSIYHMMLQQLGFDEIHECVKFYVYVNLRVYVKCKRFSNVYRKFTYPVLNEEMHGDLCFSLFGRCDTIMKLQSQTTHRS